MYKQVLAAIALVSAPASASAAIITHSFVAERSDVFNMAGSGSITETATSFNVITGSFTYDTATPSTFSGLDFSGYETGDIIIDQFDLSLFGSSRFFVEATNSVNTIGTTLDSFEIYSTIGTDFLNIQLFDFTGAVFNTTDIPQLLTLNDFSQVEFQFTDFAANARTKFTLTDLQRISVATDVPTPGTVPIIVAGLAGLGLTRMKRKRS